MRGDEDEKISKEDQQWLDKVDSSEIIIDYTQMKLIEEESKQKEKPL